MTSAPSHRPPLSGNKRLILLVLPVLLFSCGAFNTLPTADVPDNRPVVTEDPVKEDPIQDPDVVPNQAADQTVYHQVFFQGYEFQVQAHKQEFSIAVILPFHKGYKSPQEKMRAELMLEYYQGILVALDELAGSGIRYTLKVYDSQNDSLVVKRILRKSELKKVDLIIGPTDQSQVLITAKFAKEHQIPLFSPITVIDDLSISNPYLFNLSPSNKVKAEEFVEYFKLNHYGKKLILVRDGGRFDRGFGSALIKALEGSGINSQVVSYGRDQSWNGLLNASSHVIVHLSEDKSKVNTSVTAMMGTKKEIFLYGSDRWLDFSSVDFSFWNQLNVHFITDDLAETGNARSLEMRRSFRTKYNGDPSNFSYAGYDQMLFAGQLLHAFGEYFPTFVTGHTFEYSNSRFKLEEINNCYHNRYLHIIAFKNNKLEAIELR